MSYTVMLKAPLVPHNGYGNDSFGIIRQIMNSKQDLRLLPTVVFPPLPMYVAVHLVNGPDSNADLLLHTADPGLLGLSSGDRFLAGKNALKVAWTMWEWNSFDSHPQAAENLAERLSTYDMLVVYDTVSAAALGPYAEQAQIPMRVLQGGFSSDEWKSPMVDGTKRVWPDEDPSVPFRFVMVGDSLRKDPFIATQALEIVRQTHPEVELHLKGTGCIHPAFEANNPGLIVHNERMSQVELKRLYYHCHAYLGPSRGEGKNLPALEAQTTGIPAVYTAVGGHLAWGDSSYGYPVTTHPLDDGSVQADLDSLVAQMLACVENVSEARRKGELASRVIPSMCDWEGVWRQFMSLTRDFTPTATPAVKPVFTA